MKTKADNIGYCFPLTLPSPGNPCEAWVGGEGKKDKGLDYWKNLTVVILIFSFMLLGCKGKEETKEPMPESAYNVRVWNAKKEDVLKRIVVVGTLEPNEEVIVSSEISGVISSILHDEGDMVNIGEPLAAVGGRELRLKVERAEALLKKASADQDFAQSSFARKEELFKEGVITKEEHEAAFAKRNWERANVEAVKAELALAVVDLKNSAIKAPFKGFISERYVSVGSYVKEGDKLFKLIATDPIKVSAEIAEIHLDEVRAGQSVRLKVLAYPKEFVGQIYFVSPRIDEKNRTFEIKAQIKNPDGILKPGLFANVILFTGELKGVILVPESGVVMREDNVVVFVVKDDKAHERQITPRERMEGRVVVADGITQGDVVVVDGAQNLKDGVKVKVK